MDELLHANIFFFITSIAVIVVTVFLVVLLHHLIQIARDAREITNMVKEESTEIAEDLEELRDTIKKEGFRLWHFFAFLVGRRRRRISRKRE